MTEQEGGRIWMPAPKRKRRVSIVKIVTFEGPAEWVENCLSGGLGNGTSRVGDDKYVTVSNGTPKEETPSDTVAFDHDLTPRGGLR